VVVADPSGPRSLTGGSSGLIMTVRGHEQTIKHLLK
jgi:hypothetical protein